MTSKEIGARLVELCKAGKNHEAIQQLYATDIVSIEAGAPPGQSPEVNGLPAVLAKAKHWAETNEVHSMKVEGPFPHGDRFAGSRRCRRGRRTDKQHVVMREVALYTVKGDKIVREEFFYSMG
jgi:ketosteroid isomerase-like protein